MMWWYGSGMGAWGYALMAISLVLFWAVLIVIVVALVRYFGRGGSQQGTGPAEPSSPERLLAERFARGEINDEEYQRRLATLHSAGQSAAGNGRTRPPAGTAAK